jgi:hypothetical protein
MTPNPSPPQLRSLNACGNQQIQVYDSAIEHHISNNTERTWKRRDCTFQSVVCVPLNWVIRLVAHAIRHRSNIVRVSSSFQLILPVELSMTFYPLGYFGETNKDWVKVTVKYYMLAFAIAVFRMFLLLEAHTVGRVR